MEDIVETINLAVYDVSNFQITIDLQDSIYENYKILHGLYNLVSGKPNSKIEIDEMLYPIKKATLILELFYDFHAHAECIQNICLSFPEKAIDITLLDEKKHQNLSDITIRDLCTSDEVFDESISGYSENSNEIALSNSEIAFLNEQFLSYFHIFNDNLPIIMTLKRFHASGIRLFMEKCKSLCEELLLNESQRVLGLPEIFDIIIQPCMRFLIENISNILLGKISGEHLKTFFPIGCEEKEISLELKNLCDLLEIRENSDVNSIKECASKIKCLYNFESSFQVATQVLNVKQALELDENFDAIKFICSKQQELKDIELQAVDKVFMEDVKKLKSVTPEMEEIFLVVAKCLPLINWLRKELKDPKEVKTFVDLMSIAAGESDLEVKRVACFEASCQAFSPILFDLDAQSGFVSLVIACNKVLTAKVIDPDIKEKLIDTNRFLTWYEEAKKSQGSVEKKSIYQTQLANRYGRYLIGNITGEDDYFIHHEADLHDVIVLEVLESDNGTKEQTFVKKYSLSDIDDLKSRLMLLGSDVNSELGETIQFEKEYFLQVCCSIHYFVLVILHILPCGVYIFETLPTLPLLQIS